jgi:hypothetical protein
MDDSSFDRINWHLPPTDGDDLRCRKYLAVALGCMTPKNHLRSWYAFGHGANCSQERSNLYSCMRLKMARSDTKQKILEDNREFVTKTQSIPNNHFWKERSSPVDSWPVPENPN